MDALTVDAPHIAPPPAAADPRRWWILAVLCLGLVLITVDNTILNVALPTLARELDAGSSELQWIVDSYVLVFASLLLTFGALGDRFGRRGALLAGLLIFGAGSAAAAMADTSAQLIAARALMGVGGAFVMPATLSILTNVFTDPGERARAIGIWAGVAGLGVALGPVTGGWLLEHFWWGSVFLVNVPVLAVLLVGTLTIVPTSRDPEQSPLDLGGAALSITGLTALLWAIIEAPERGWSDPVVLGAATLALLLAVAFVRHERHQVSPMLDVRFFRDRRFSAASGAVTLTFFALFGTMFVLTQHLQFVMGYDALDAGVRYLPFAAVMLLVAPMSARIAERIGTKSVVAAGLVGVAAGMALLLRVTTSTGYGAVLASQLVMAVGFGLVMAPATESIMGSLPPSKAGVGSAVNDTTREVGGALGVAVLGSVMSSVFGRGMDDELDDAGLPPALAEPARESMGAAVGVATDVGGTTGARVLDAARTAFVDGLHVTTWVSLAFVAAGLTVVLVALPQRGR